MTALMEFLQSWYAHAWGFINPALLIGATMTIKLTVVSLALSVALGALVGTLRMIRHPAIRYPTYVYVELIRGTPLLVQMFVIYFGLAQLGLMFTSFQAAVLALSLNGGAYVGEIFRAGYQAVPRGQMEAALSVGMSHAVAWWRVVMPQAMRIVLPPMANYSVALLKYTSLASAIAAPELMVHAENLNSETFRTMEIYTTVALMYLAMAYPLSLLVAYLERTMGQAEPVH